MQPQPSVDATRIAGPTQAMDSPLDLLIAGADIITALAALAMAIVLVRFMLSQRRRGADAAISPQLLLLLAAFATVLGLNLLDSGLGSGYAGGVAGALLHALQGLLAISCAGALVPALRAATSLMGPAQQAREAAARAVDERRLARTMEQLRQSNADLEQFAYVASHDLRAPLRNIASFADLARSKSGGTLNAEVMDCLDTVADGAHRMQSMIDDLLELSRVDNMQPADDEHELAALCDEAIDNLSSLVWETQAEIAVAGDLPRVRGDRGQIIRVLQNLIGNALKFQARGQSPKIEIGARPADGRVVITVGDNGIGIDAPHHDKIFKLFNRLHGDDEYPGTGMGLSICKKIIERHGGQIGVDSAPGAGARFYFDLALATA